MPSHPGIGARFAICTAPRGSPASLQHPATSDPGDLDATEIGAISVELVVISGRQQAFLADVK